MVTQVVRWLEDAIESFVKANYKQGMSEKTFAKLFAEELEVNMEKYRKITTYQTSSASLQ